MKAAPDLNHIIADELSRLVGNRQRLGIAVSGGSDSMALMHLVQEWAGARHVQAATVDHGLRPESAQEAVLVGKAADRLGIAHEILLWQRGDGGGNLMAAAREARLRLLADWAGRRGLEAVLLGHTQDDQAETVLMRLARGAGVDGLSGMAASRWSHDMLWLRPMLGMRRIDLRDWLRGREIGWIDDPSNDNPDYERVRVRKAMALLQLSPAALAQTADNLAMARSALQDFSARVCQGASATHGALHLSLNEFSDAPEDVQRRILVAALRWMTGAAYPPRRGRVANGLMAIRTGRTFTVEGVLLRCRADRIELIREPAAAKRAAAARPDGQGGAIWDGRWQISGLSPEDRVKAVTTAPLSDLHWRASGLSYDEAAASPGVWRDGRLIAAPLLEPDGRFTAIPLRDMVYFRAMIFSH